MQTVVGNLSVEKQESMFFPLEKKSFWLPETEERYLTLVTGLVSFLFTVFCPPSSREFWRERFRISDTFTFADEYET